MPDEAAFIQTIREHPDDDGPRLVYADWLEEHGECDRAEFIRVQIELARGVKDEKRREKLNSRQRFLLEKPIGSWVLSIANWLWTWGCRRGLLEVISCQASDFIRHGSRLLDQAPVLEAKLNGVSARMPVLVQASHLRKLDVLDLSRTLIVSERLQMLLASRFLDRLQTLVLDSTPIGNEGVWSVLVSRSVPHLRVLRLSNTGMIGGAWMPRTCQLRNLVELDLSENQLGGRGMDALAGFSAAEKIQRLNLSFCGLGAELASLTESRRFLNLTELNLSKNPIGDAGAAMLANSTFLSGLESLTLHDADIGWAGARTLAQSQLLEGLRHLDLSGNRLNSRQRNRLELRFGSRVKF